MKMLRRLALAAASLSVCGFVMGTETSAQAEGTIVQTGCSSCGSSGHMAPVMSHPVPMMQPQIMMPVPMMQPQMARPNFNIAPPPGTLGTTYRRHTKPVPLDKHPRVAMLEVRNAGSMEVVVEGLEKFKGFRGDDGIWRFESDKPLIPGLPHIYTIKIGTPDAYGKVAHYQIFKIRMIPGRIVFL